MWHHRESMHQTSAARKKKVKGEREGEKGGGRRQEVVRNLTSWRSCSTNVSSQNSLNKQFFNRITRKDADNAPKSKRKKEGKRKRALSF